MTAPLQFREFFQQRTGFAPLPFQERAAELMLGGHNTVLTAPTGSGKTWAVVAPFLYALETGVPLGDRLLYALPLRSLASSLWSRMRESSGLDLDAVRLQTGSAQEDPFFGGRVTFTTIDQLLSSYLTVPVSLSRRLGNINAGALVGAVVVFDEIHLLDPAQALGTALEMARRLAGFAQVIMMTATLPSGCVRQLCSALRAEHVPFTDEDLENAPRLGNRDRRWTWIDEPLSAERILREHKGGRTLVVCNSVVRAQALYRALSSRLSADCVLGGDCVSTRCVLLHARFLPEHRRTHEAVLEDAFGKDAALTDVIGVATQVVEAGLDWGADTLHTELAPANTLVQRAGRCARFEAPRNVGRIFVYEVERTPDGRPRLGPYRERSAQVDETRRSLEWMRNEALDSEAEARLVDAVHARSDENALRSAIDNLQHRATEIEHRVFEGGEIAALSDLVRDIDSVNVVVTDQPEAIDLESGPRSVGVPRTSLGALARMVGQAQGWEAAFAPQMENDGQVVWRRLATFREIRSAPWFLALSPRVAGYSSELGLTLGEAGEPFALSYAERPPRLAPQYKLESWEEHAWRVSEQAEASRPAWASAARRLDTVHRLPKGTAAEALRLVCLLHDFGKLSIPWQDVMQRWQEEKDPTALAALHGAPLAHTDYNPTQDWRRQREVGDPPPHAMEGAYGAVRIGRRFGAGVNAGNEARSGLVRAILTAIGRHHGPRTRQVTAFLWNPTWQSVLERTLGDLGTEAVLQLQARDHVRADQFKSSVILDAAQSGQTLWLPMYWFLVRNLRLADQASQATRQ